MFCLGPDNPPQSPGAGDDAFDQDGFQFSLRLKLCYQSIAEFSQQRAIFARKKHIPGKQAMSDRIHPGNSLARLGLNSPLEGIFPVGFKLFLGSYGNLLCQPSAYSYQLSAVSNRLQAVSNEQ